MDVSPAIPASGNLIFPNGFHYQDKIEANQKTTVNGIVWYAVFECVRKGVTS